jgi:type I restriction enzyme M protein
MKDRVHRDFSPEDIEKIEQTYHAWRSVVRADSISAPYKDIKGFCKSATLEDIEKHGFVLTPGRYVGIPDEEDDGIPFEEKMNDLTATLARQIEKEKELDEQLKEQLAKVGFAL